jgi:ABC-type multidrug transport system fused ATPase/permease subunit
MIQPSNIAQYVASTYRQEYFESILRKPIPFYDEAENSSGTLNSRLSVDPQQLQELLGPNMAFPLISIFSILGAISIAFAFGWKLTVVVLFSALPFTFLAAFMRVRFEIQFEGLNAKVFAESSQFAAEAIGAFRTVTALTLEDTITTRYSGLLQEHVTKAFRKAQLATLIFAASDSIELLCMALGFWYGGQLLASHEYNVVQFFVIYVAVVQGGQSAGQFFSFGPNIAQATAAANRILSFRLRSEPDRATNSEGGNALEGGDGGTRIEFKDVSFKYPTRDVPVFAHLNLTVGYASSGNESIS